VNALITTLGTLSIFGGIALLVGGPSIVDLPATFTVLGQTEILGRKCLRNVPEGVDIVDVFRSPEHMSAVVEEAIRVGAKAIWMQLGTSNSDAVRRADEADLEVVVEKCIKVAHKVLRIS